MTLIANTNSPDVVPEQRHAQHTIGAHVWAERIRRDTACAALQMGTAATFPL